MPSGSFRQRRPIVGRSFTWDGGAVRRRPPTLTTHTSRHRSPADWRAQRQQSLGPFRKSVVTTLPAQDSVLPAGQPAPRRLSRKPTGADRGLRARCPHRRCVRARHHRRRRRLPRLAGRPDAAALRVVLLHRDRSGSPRATCSASPRCWSAPFQVAMVAMAIAFPLALLTALYISEYAPARHQAHAGLAGRPDGRGARRSSTACGASSWSCRTPPPSRCGCTSTSAGSRSSRSTPTRTPPSGTRRATSPAPSAPASPSR